MGMDAHCVRILFRRKMRGFRRKPTEENSQERISGQELARSGLKNDFETAIGHRRSSFVNSPGQSPAVNC